MINAMILIDIVNFPFLDMEIYFVLQLTWNLYVSSLFFFFFFFFFFFGFFFKILLLFFLFLFLLFFKILSTPLSPGIQL